MAEAGEHAQLHSPPTSGDIDSHMDKFKAMEVFVRVAECGNFSRAAESLRLSNATVTAAVRFLEETLNLRLVMRDSRRVVLTQEGERVLPRVREILQSVGRLEDEGGGQSDAPVGSLHVEVPIGFGQSILAPALPTFLERYPGIRVTLTLTNEPHNLTARAVDLAVRADRVENDGYVVRPLFEAQYVICGAPDVVASLPPDPADLDPSLCISMMPEESRRPMPWILTRADREVLIEPAGRVHFNNAEAALTLVKKGLGLASVLDFYAASHLESGAVARAYPGWSMRKKPGYLVMTKERASSPKVRAFAEFLLDLIGPANRPNVQSKVRVKQSLGSA
jgi:LysR family transcriptional regulator, regulator for bpeEF and oprC